MDVLGPTIVGALAATVGVVLGGWLARRGQHGQWLHDQQLAAYLELFRHYSVFTMELKRAHADRRAWDHDWGSWSAALVTGSLVAPAGVASRIDDFGVAVEEFLDTVARGIDTTTAPLSDEQFQRASVALAVAQLALVNTIRTSFDRRHRPLPRPLGGAPVDSPGQS